ncbi:MAG: hypothetical protein IIZ40_01930 [Bacilli bacterium]|nr:hypothetical protein [Bacilli bacterium]
MKYEIKDNKLLLHVFDVDKTIKKTKKLIRLCDRKKLELVINGNTNEDLEMIKNAINIKNREDRYNYIYDTVCKILDDRICNENYCEFENDVCIRFKKENPNHKNGCCEWKGRGKCKYLINSVCTMKTCMACKLFTCPFLYKEKGIKQRVNDYVLIKYFFNRNQKYILECSFWTPKEIVMKRLLANKFNINE